MAERIDHDLMVEQDMPVEYSASPNLINYIKALISEHDNLEDVFLALLERLDIDEAAGERLDLIGRIVGQPRVTIGASEVVFFGFDDHPQANGFGDSTDPSQGGRFRETGESLTGNKRLIDSEYRVFIRARIVKNHSKSRPNDIIEALRFIFDVDLVYMQNATPKTGFSRLIFSRELTPNETALLLNSDIVPRTVGTTHQYFDVDRAPFGFLGVPGAAGFGDPSDPLVGGTFPRIIA